MIALRTFGALELTSTDGKMVSSILAQPRRAALLCYLALAAPRGFQRRDSLFTLFWPEHDAEQARHALRQSVYFLRRALGPMAIVSRGDHELSLAPGHVRCDVWEFTAALDQGRVTDALALYRGELLAGFHISDAPEFERWVEAERSRLKEQARDAAWTLASACEREGDASGAAEAARRAVALAPTDEIAFRRLLLLLERVGDRAAVVRAYEGFASRLREEYELEPSAETHGLVDRIRGEALESRTAAGTLPKSAMLPPSRARQGVGLAAGAVTVALALGLAWLPFRTTSRDDAAGVLPVPIGEPAPAIAVLPFDVRDDSLAHWREGLMDLVSMDLAGIPGLHALDSRTVLARWREEVMDREPAASAAALEAAERAGGRYAVAGRVIAEGADLLLTASVYEVDGRRVLGTARSRGPADSIFALVDHLTLQILQFIPGGVARGRARMDQAGVTTASLPALKAFLEGEVHFRRSQFESAAVAYGTAVEADSTFALARYRLGVSRQWFWNDVLGTTPDPLETTVGQLADRLPEHEAAMFRAYLLSNQDVTAARDLLEEESRRHPDNAETWYQLGEFYYHSGPAVLVSPGAADQALARAIALDSTFSLPYIHRIEYAVLQRDTASANQLLLMFARLAPDTPHLVQLRLLTGLVVGDSVARSASEAALNNLENYRLLWLGGMLYAARRFDLSEQVFRMARNHRESRPGAAIRLFFADLAQGQAHEAQRWLDDADMPESRRASMLQALAEVGMQVPVRERDMRLPRDAADTVAAFQLFYLGAFAASQGRWDIARGWMDRLQDRARTLRVAGDTSEADFTEAMQVGVEGYMQWRQGHRDRALLLLKRSQRRALCCPAPLVNERLRWWLGELLVEMGRLREARPYFESLAATWLPADHALGQVYEQLGMTEPAREAYARFLAPRQQADSEFQSMIQDARTALERLSRGAQ